MSIRILIVDDHGVLRGGLRALLNTQPDFNVVGEAGDGEEALRLAEASKPDVVLLDIGLPGQNGIEVAGRLSKRLPETRILMMTAHEDHELVRKSLEAGAVGYIVKRAAESELIDAVRAVQGGGLYIHPTITRALLPQPVRVPHGQTLTPREIEVLRLLVQGYTNTQSAAALSISVRTVESHRANMMGKLELKTRKELVKWAVENGLISPLVNTNERK